MWRTSYGVPYYSSTTLIVRHVIVDIVPLCSRSAGLMEPRELRWHLTASAPLTCSRHIIESFYRHAACRRRRRRTACKPRRDVKTHWRWRPPTTWWIVCYHRNGKVLAAQRRSQRHAPGLRGIMRRRRILLSDNLLRVSPVLGAIASSPP